MYTSSLGGIEPPTLHSCLLYRLSYKDMLPGFPGRKREKEKLMPTTTICRCFPAARYKINKNRLCNCAISHRYHKTVDLFTPLGSCAVRGMWRGMVPRRIKKGGMKRKDTGDSPRPTFAGRVSKEDVEGESSWILFILYIRFCDFAIVFAVSPQQIFDDVRCVCHCFASSSISTAKAIRHRECAR